MTKSKISLNSNKFYSLDKFAKKLSSKGKFCVIVEEQSNGNLSNKLIITDNFDQLVDLVLSEYQIIGYSISDINPFSYFSKDNVFLLSNNSSDYTITHKIFSLDNEQFDKLEMIVINADDNSIN